LSPRGRKTLAFILMRITGGRARGITILLPKRGELRPSTDAMRAALFSSLGPLVVNARMLDLFAGTGAYGLEALSRGAVHVTWVDQNQASASIIKINLAAVAKSMGESKPDSLGRAIDADALTWQPQPGVYFDIILAAPPYPLLEQHAGKILARAVTWLAQAETSRLILEAPGAHESPPPSGAHMIKRIGSGARQPSALIFGLTHATAG